MPHDTSEITTFIETLRRKTIADEIERFGVNHEKRLNELI